MKKRALVSVYEKKDVLEFCRKLKGLDWEIISTGGTYKYLSENGVEPIKIEEVTNFPEILDGRVKTLNPKIHGGILFKRNNEKHLKTLKENDIQPIDMVVNNLYPFEKKLKEKASHDEMIENIDIGGPSMIRAAAKNYKDVLIVTDSSDYQRVLDALQTGEISDEFRLDLAKKAFAYTANYDAMISNYFNEICNDEFPELLAIPYRKKQELRYGENPHQKSCFYENTFIEKNYEIKKLHGKELSHNNLADVFGVIKALKEFKEPACVGVKHTNPSGIGVGKDIYEAYMKAYESDTESIFGGIIAVNRELDEKTAEHMSGYFLEIVIAPKFSEKAFEILSRKKNIRLLEIENINEFELEKKDFKQVLGGIVYQEHDNFTESEKNFDFKFVTKRKPTEKEIEDLKFAWKCAKNIASNGVVLAKDGGTVGIGQGEVRRSWAVEEALQRAKGKLDGAVLASDAFFFEDTVELLHSAGVKAMMSPGGSIKDQKVIDL